MSVSSFGLNCFFYKIDPGTVAWATIQSIAQLMAVIMNSFSSGMVPAHIKIVKIPICKSGEKYKINYYRLISILPYFL